MHMDPLKIYSAFIVMLAFKEKCDEIQRKSVVDSLFAVLFYQSKVFFKFIMRAPGILNQI